VSWRLALLGEQDAPMNIFGQNWHEAIAAAVAVAVAVSAQPATVEPNRKPGKPGKCTSIQASSDLSHTFLSCQVLSGACMRLAHLIRESHQRRALVLTRLMRHLSWAAWMRLQDKWSMHACA